MKKHVRENIWITILLLLLSIYVYFNVNYLDRFVLEKQSPKQETSSN